jgi:transposase-like protein
MGNEPTTLQEAILYFADPDNCVAYLVARRWPDGVVCCPTCGSGAVRYMPTRRVWQCKARHAKCQFSIKVGTIFEDSAIGLDKWLTAMWLMANSRNGVSSWEIHRSLGVTQKTAWFMLHRIRLVVQDSEGGAQLSGIVEADETFVGGKVKNMHKDKKPRGVSKSRGVAGKTIVLGMLERGGRVKAQVVADRTQAILHEQIGKHVEEGTNVVTDEWRPYNGLDQKFVHDVINHAQEYVRGHVHTNGIENFWSLLKRGLGGTYISVEPFHLFRYIDEQAFRFNNRFNKRDAERFSIAVSQIVGKRLTYEGLTGKVAARPF